MEKCLKIGPWGGKGGDPRGFTAEDQTGITYIEVFHGGVIDSITFKWGDEQRPHKNSYKIGGDGGHSGGKILLDWPRVYLTSISGTFDSYEGNTVINSLRLKTNMEQEEYSYGSGGGTAFSVPMEGGEIVGFHGRAGLYVDAIGISVKVI